MIRFVAGIIVGIVICTIGFSGVAKLLDNGVQTIQSKSKELAQ